MVADKGKKAKVVERGEGDADHIDGELVLSIGKLQEIQDEIEKINEEASDKVLEVEQKYNEVRRPVYKRRNENSGHIFHRRPARPRRRLGLADSKPLVRKAEELRRLSDVQFDSSIIGIGEVTKAIIYLEIAVSKFQALFDRQSAIRMSGMSEKAYMRSFNAMQNGLGVKMSLDVRELGIQFGCVRLIPFVQKGLALYRERFLAALPPTCRANTDFNRSVFTAVAFYLCAKRHKLKVDKTS